MKNVEQDILYQLAQIHCTQKNILLFLVDRAQEDRKEIVDLLAMREIRETLAIVAALDPLAMMEPP